jgi:hypothetical protein
MADQPTKDEAPQAQETKETIGTTVPPAPSSEVQPQGEDPVKETETPTPQPVEEKKSEESGSAPVWPELAPDHPLSNFCSELESIRSAADYHEVYGVDISDSNSFHTKLILQKFLRANANDIEKAEEQLLATLKWRKEFQPLEQLKASHNKESFGGLGYVMIIDGVPGSSNEKDVVTFNLYGAVKDNKKVFGDLIPYVLVSNPPVRTVDCVLKHLRWLQWRVALMELSLQKLDLQHATKPIPDYGKGPDPYQGIQIHDYLSISFLRQDPLVKAASQKAIEVFSKYYPETLSRKFFVNVPAVMGWLYAAIKLVLPRETVRKFTVMSYGNQLVMELGSGVPEVYGGEGQPLESIGEQPLLSEKEK